MCGKGGGGVEEDGWRVKRGSEWLKYWASNPDRNGWILGQLDSGYHDLSGRDCRDIARATEGHVERHAAPPLSSTTRYIRRLSLGEGGGILYTSFCGACEFQATLVYDVRVLIDGAEEQDTTTVLCWVETRSTSYSPGYDPT